MTAVQTDRHGITVVVVPNPAGRPLRASCLCGWESPIVPSRPQAAAQGEAHLSQVSREHARDVREGIENAGGVESPSAAEARQPRYPVVGVDGELCDLYTPSDARDPFMGPCPEWCVDSSDHRPEMHESDRIHYGPRYGVPVRSLPAGEEHDGGHILGAATLYLRQHNGAAEPTIWLGQGETSVGLEFTLDEARDTAEVLQQCVLAAGQRPADYTIAIAGALGCAASDLLPPHGAGAVR